MAERRSVFALSAVCVFVLAMVWLIFQPVGRESSASIRPEPLAPFGPVAAGSLEFSWARPSDGAPVRVEVLDVGLAVLWSSETTKGTSLRPGDDAIASLPQGDMLWRAVAVSEDGGERPGDAAAFFLVRD